MEESIINKQRWLKIVHVRLEKKKVFVAQNTSFTNLLVFNIVFFFAKL